MIDLSAHRCSVIAAVLLLLATGCFGDERFIADSVDTYPDLLEGYQRTVLFLPEVLDVVVEVDGKLDEDAWQKAVTFDGFQQIESALPMPDKIATQGRILRTAEGLYVGIVGKRAPLPPAFDVDGKPVKPVPEVIAENGQDIFALQFSSKIEEFTRYRFGIMPNGMKYSLRHFLVPSWSPKGWEAAYQSTDTHLIVEFFIPYHLLRDEAPQQGDIMAMNVMRYAYELQPVPGGPFRYKTHETYQWRSGQCHATSPVDHFPWLYFGSQDQFEKTPRAPVVRTYLDKTVYDHADEAGESYIEMRFGNLPVNSLALQVQIVDSQGKVCAAQQFDSLKSPDVGCAFYPATLPAGDYTFRVTALRNGQPVSIGERGFTVAAEKPTLIAKPDTIDLVLTDDATIGTGVRPITTAVPLPRGVLFEKDLKNVTVERRVLTNDDPAQQWKHEWIPVETQVDIRNRWYRDGSIRWLGVAFDAEYYRGRQRAILGPEHPYFSTYRVSLNTKQKPIEQPLTISETDDEFIINTGPMKAVVSRKNFQLLSKAFLDRNGDGQFEDSELLIDAKNADGLKYKTDGEELLSAAHSKTKVYVESAGPMRACIVAEGWYADGDEPVDKHMTRLFFHRGQPTVRVHHTFINTVDTDKHKIGNIASRLGVRDVQRYMFGAEGNMTFEGDVQQGSSTYLLQHKHDAFVIEQEGNAKAATDGGRTAGWLTAITPRGSVQLTGRRLWQLYPKELEVGSNFIALHTWPKHGRTVFSEDEIAHPLATAQAIFAHHGKTMNMKLPETCYQTMGHAFSQDMFFNQDKEAIAPRISGFSFNYAWEAKHANGQGLAFTTEYNIRLQPPVEEVDAREQHSIAKAFKADPQAIADPKWTYQSRILGELWPQDYKRFGSIENAIDQTFQNILVDQADRLGDYGQLNWPDYHTYSTGLLTGNFEADWFHRTWSGTHYQEGRTFYLLYLRSGDHRYWQYARDSARRKMDINTVNYASNPRVGKNQTPWGTYHVYGVFGWSGMQGISCHYQNHDFKAWESILTGDPRGKRQALNWGKELARSTWATESTRDATGTLSEALEVYQCTRYAPMLKSIHWFKEACLSTPFDQFILPNFSKMVWWRLHDYTRDPRVAQRLVEQWGDGNESKRNGVGHPISQLMMYRLTGDERIISTLSFMPPRREVYLPGITPPQISWPFTTLPYAMSGLNSVGASGDVQTDRSIHEAFWADKKEKWKAEGKSIWGHPIE